MSIRKPKPKSAIDDAIDMALIELRTYDPASDDYAQVLTQLEKLHKMKVAERPDRVSKDVWVTAGVNLAGILIIIGYEQTHVIASKAVGFVLKLR
jgi:hypothetical protein